MGPSSSTHVKWGWGGKLTVNVILLWKIRTNGEHKNGGSMEGHKRGALFLIEDVFR